MYDTYYEHTHPYQDCVPDTLKRVFPQYSTKELRVICKTERDGTPLTNIMSAWTKLSTNKLIINYSVFPSIPIDSNEGVDFTVPYMWVGTWKTSGHCALVWFGETNVLVSSSQYQPGTTNYVINVMDYYEFFERTLMLFKAKELDASIRMY